MMRSGFGVRRHPILGYMKMHTGVDWAAPNGTPIYASGNGSVEKVGWESGYGEIMVNGRFVDPMRIKLPRGRVLEGPVLAGFERERERLEGLLSRAPARVAQSGQSASR